MIYQGIKGVPRFDCAEFSPKSSDYCICIPIINEGARIKKELDRAKASGIDKLCDIAICDGGSTDGSTDPAQLKDLGVNSLLTKFDAGKQSAQLRMGFWWALQRGYRGIITVDGNDKDSIESVPLFIERLEMGYDFVQGSRYIKGGRAVNTPMVRHLAVRLLHSPLTSLIAGHHFTDTTNAFRGHSRKYLLHPKVLPFRDSFITYELLAYLSVRASQLGLRVCEVPVRREYPRLGEVPTKIKGMKGNLSLLWILLQVAVGRFSV